MQFMVLISFISMIAFITGCRSTGRRVTSRGSLEDAFNAYANTCSNDTCPCSVVFKGGNCAHFLSNALIQGGFEELHGGDSNSCKERSPGPSHRMFVCQNGRPIRAKELRDWFSSLYNGKKDKPRVGINFVYQEKRFLGCWPWHTQGHVLLKKYTQTMVDNYCNDPRVYSREQNYRGTGDYEGLRWWRQEFYYPNP